MRRLILLACSLIFTLSLARSQSDKFPKYKPIEAYEILPDVMMMPRYSPDGSLCEVAVQREHYLNGKVYLDASLTEEEINRAFNELAPPDERGQLIQTLGSNSLSFYIGNGVTTYKEFENVSISTLGKSTPPSEEGDVVAVIRWKGRSCQK